MALVHAALDNLDLALTYLDRTFASDPSTLRLISVDPSADPLRGDPRFQDLLDRLASLGEGA